MFGAVNHRYRRKPSVDKEVADCLPGTADVVDDDACAIALQVAVEEDDGGVDRLDEGRAGGRSRRLRR